MLDTSTNDGAGTIDEHNPLICPGCKFSQLHHQQVTVYDRKEDAEAVTSARRWRTPARGTPAAVATGWPSASGAKGVTIGTN
jgi:hypothetical protein